MPRDSSGTKEKVRLVLDGICRQGKVAELCKQVGISRSTYYRWRKSPVKKGRKGLADASSSKIDHEEARPLAENTTLKNLLQELVTSLHTDSTTTASYENSGRLSQRKLREDQLMEVAARLFASRGYHGTSMEDIASAFGILKGSLYHYVESKEDLLIKVQGTAMQQMIIGLSRILEVEASYSEKLRAAFVYHLSFFGVLYARVVAFAGHSLDELPPALRERTREERSRYERLWRRLVTEGQSCGEFRRDLDVAMAVRALLGMANWLSIWYREKGEWQPSQIAEVFAKIALEGLAQSRSG
jgi:AcrR family transcriptional regulator